MGKKEKSEAAAAEAQKTEAGRKEQNTTPKPEQKNPKKAQKNAEHSKRPEEQGEQLQKQIDEQKDQLLRMAAEYDNFRKRSQREKETAYADAKADALCEILPVLDNFERAADNAETEFEDYKKGVEMIYHQFTEILQKLGVEAFGEEGDPFDPQLHNAMMHIDDETLAENVIAQVFAKGYRLGDRVMRHAVVKVAN